MNTAAHCDRADARLAGPRAAAQELQLPVVVSNLYRLEQCLGGGMAKVYRSIDLTLEREVAVKLINLELRNEPEFDGVGPPARRAIAGRGPSIPPDRGGQRRRGAGRLPVGVPLPGALQAELSARDLAAPHCSQRLPHETAGAIAEPGSPNRRFAPDLRRDGAPQSPGPALGGRWPGAAHPGRNPRPRPGLHRRAAPGA